MINHQNRPAVPLTSVVVTFVVLYTPLQKTPATENVFSNRKYRGLRLLNHEILHIGLVPNFRLFVSLIRWVIKSHPSMHVINLGALGGGSGGGGGTGGGGLPVLSF